MGLREYDFIQSEQTDMSTIIKDTLSMLRESDDENKELRELNAELLQELKNIESANWDDFNARDFVGWAKSRARAVIARTEKLK